MLAPKPNRVIEEFEDLPRPLHPEGSLVWVNAPYHEHDGESGIVRGVALEEEEESTCYSYRVQLTAGESDTFKGRELRRR